MVDVGRLFGRSMAFPPHLDGGLRFDWSVAADNIRESIQIILLTEPGERLMLPGFGAGLKQFLFEPNTVGTHRLMQERIQQSLVIWEPRVEVRAIDVFPDVDDGHACWVVIRYVLVTNRQQDQIQLRVKLTG